MPSRPKVCLVPKSSNADKDIEFVDKSIFSTIPLDKDPTIKIVGFTIQGDSMDFAMGRDQSREGSLEPQK